MTHDRIAFNLFAVAAVVALASLPVHAQESQSRGQQHWQDILAKPWAKDFRSARLANVRRVEEKPNLFPQTVLPPVWVADIVKAKRKSGYMMWLADGDGDLIEFAIDAELSIGRGDDLFVAGAPPILQFAIDDGNEKPVASGCVPTSGATVVGFLVNTYPKWRGDLHKELGVELTKRIRNRMEMQRIPDEDGFADGKMALAGSNAYELAKGIQEDADQFGVPVKVAVAKFSDELLRKELSAGRPAVVMGVVRVPQKPHLTWGHSLAAVGYSKLGDQGYVGVLDNFYPTRCPHTVRWMRSNAFNTILAIHPAGEDVPKMQTDRK